MEFRKLKRTYVSVYERVLVGIELDNQIQMERIAHGVYCIEDGEI